MCFCRCNGINRHAFLNYHLLMCIHQSLCVAFCSKRVHPVPSLMTLSMRVLIDNIESKFTLETTCSTGFFVTVILLCKLLASSLIVCPMVSRGLVGLLSALCHFEGMWGCTTCCERFLFLVNEFPVILEVCHRRCSG